jgi:predicted nucleic acid-binding protein
VGLIADLGPGPNALDTAIFIYFIEENPRFLPHIFPLFAEADEGQRDLVTSALTLLEVLVVPHRAGRHTAGQTVRAPVDAKSWDSPDGVVARSTSGRGATARSDRRQDS